jgi:tripartite-type tricarboxylate transporter receptor subunit TctC
MAMRKTLPANNLHELATWLKSNNGSAASTGTASMARFCGMGFEKATGTTLQYVPYRGGAPALNDLVAGQIDLDCDLAANSLAQYRAGNVKVLAVMTKTRWAAAPDVPSVDEAGFPGLYYSTWHGIWAPKGTPADIVARINAAAVAAMADPATRQRITDLGMTTPPAEQQTPAAFAAFHKAEVEKWYPIVRAAGVKAE